MSNKKHHLIYNGKRQKATSGKAFANINPATNQVINEIEAASKEDVEKIIESAKKGFAVWSKMSGTERGRILKKAVDILRERNDELAKIEVTDTGKPLSEAIEVDVVTGADAIEYYAGIAHPFMVITMIFGVHFHTPDASRLELLPELEHGTTRFRLPAGNQLLHLPPEM